MRVRSFGRFGGAIIVGCMLAATLTVQVYALPGDTVAPQAELSGPALTNVSPIDVTIRFSEAVSDLTAGSLTVTNGTAGNLTDISNTFQAKFGGNGSGDGQFQWAYDIAIDSEGNLYITDYFNHRVQVFDGAGTYLRQWGTNGYGNGQFASPAGIFIDDADNVYVVDGGHRVQIFDTQGTFLAKVAGTFGSGDGQMSFPTDVAVDGSGNIWVTEHGNDRVQVFNSAGAFVTKFGAPGTGPGEFNNPWGIAIGGDGTVYVVEREGDRIQRFTSEGAFLAQIGSAGSGDGQINDSYNLGIDDAGNIYVAEYANSRVSVFGADGNFLKSFGTSGGGDGQFTNGPSGVVVADDGSVWASGYDNRVQRFAPLGTYQVEVTPVVSGAVTVSLLAGAVSDLAGNPTTETASLSMTYDVRRPAVVLSKTAAAVNKQATVRVTITFDEAVTGLGLDDLTIGNGQASGLSSSSPAVYTVNIAPDADGQVTVDLGADSAYDAIGNGNTAAARLSWTRDTQGPDAPASVTVEAAADGWISAADAAADVAVSVSLTGTGAVAGDLLAVSWGATTVNRNLAAGDVSAGQIDVAIDAAAVSLAGDGAVVVAAELDDALGNSADSRIEITVKVDTVAPSAPAAPTSPAAEDGLIDGSEAAAGVPISLSLASTGAVAGDRLIVFWGEESTAATLSQAQVDEGTVEIVVPAATVESIGSGEIEIAASLTDAAGNEGPTSEATILTIDLSVEGGVGSQKGGENRKPNSGESGGGFSCAVGGAAGSAGLAELLLILAVPALFARRRSVRRA